MIPSFGYLWASLVAQTVKCLPAMWETQVRSLGREDPLEKETVTYSSILAWRIPWTEKPRSPWGRKESDTTERLHFNSLVAELVKNPPAMQGWEDTLEKEMAAHSSILAWEIPCTEEPGGLQSKVSQESETT